VLAVWGAVYALLMRAIDNSAQGTSATP
jgi:hypothetical protein